MANVQVQVDFVRNKRGGQSLVLGGLHVYDKYINHLGDICQLLTFSYSLGPDQAQQKVSRDQYPYRLTLWVRVLKSLSLYRGKQCSP